MKRYDSWQRTQSIEETLVSQMKDSAKAIDVPVLAYHQVKILGHQRLISRGLVVDEKSFERQMFILRALGYRTVSLIDLANALTRDSALPHRPVVITFDDGYAGAYEVAFPILRRHNFAATLFLIAEDFIASASGRNQRAFPVLNRQQVREMIKDGFGIGSHSVSHPRLTDLSNSQVKVEIQRSKKILEDAFSCGLNAFCYPYGLYDQRILMNVEEAGYSCACSTRFGRRHQAQDRFFLRRIPVGFDQGLAHFVYRLLWALDS
jgi:peptidoglycan/xylan/chitin deacetylase (PgdA/CDA1 family)